MKEFSGNPSIGRPLTDKDKSVISIGNQLSDDLKNSFKISVQSQLIADELGIPNPNDLSSILNGMPEEFQGYSKDDVIWSQHQIILKQKIEIAELQDKLNGHLKSIPINY